MRIGVLCFVLFTLVVAIAESNPLWALWGLWGLVPFAAVCHRAPDVRQRESRHFSP